MEQRRNLGVHLLNGLLLPLVSLQDLKEILVDLRLVLEAILHESSGVSGAHQRETHEYPGHAYLDLVHIRNCMVELDGATLFHA